MKSIPLLSICIPTFNRLHYLKEALIALLPQAEQHGVEVCVSDNHSTDGTSHFLGELVNEGYPSLRYIVQESNIGLDKNMMAAIGMGRGQYIYPIGDDDVLPNGAIEEILHEIENKCDLLILNGWHTDPSLIPKHSHLSTALAGRSFDKADEAFINLWDKMPFGAFLASRDIFTRSYFERFIGTSHAYAGAVWDGLADISKSKGHCIVRCMENPTVLLRGAEKTWRKDAAQIILHEIPLWFALIMEKDAYRVVAPSIRDNYLITKTRLSTLIEFRALGQLEKKDVTRLGNALTLKQVKKLNLVAHTPIIFARLLFQTRCMLRKAAKYFSK